MSAGVAQFVSIQKYRQEPTDQLRGCVSDHVFFSVAHLECTSGSLRCKITSYCDIH